MRLIYRSIFLIIFTFCLIILFWIILSSDKEKIGILKERLQEAQSRLHYIEHLNKLHENNIERISNQLSNLQKIRTSSIDQSNSSNNIAAGNLTIPGSISILQDFPTSYDLSLPNLFTYLPHLQNIPHAIQPAIKISKSRYDVTFVLGIPTIRREKTSYLISTIESLITNLDQKEKEDCLIIVSICEMNDQEYINETITNLKENFQEHMNTGLLEVLVPSPYYYPSFNDLNNRFGDTEERVKWRSKQNLDYSYLMMYAKSRGRYYVQLEDDLVTKGGFLSVMRSFAAGLQNEEWLVLEFSHLGFIGKMFKSEDLPAITEFFLMFHKDKPVDWLLDNFIAVKLCSPEKDIKFCNKAIVSLKKALKPSLFQHVGIHSSLKGKVQKLKDRYFKNYKGKPSYTNPLALTLTSINTYQDNKLAAAYAGAGIFWGTQASENDYIVFNFTKPTNVSSYHFASGDPQHPNDKFLNSSIQVLPHNSHLTLNATSSLSIRSDGYILIGWFDDRTGKADGKVPPELLPLTSLKIQFHSTLKNWVLLRQIELKEGQ